MNTANASSSKSSKTNESRPIEDLGTYIKEDRRDWGLGSRRFWASWQEYRGWKLVVISDPTPMIPCNVHIRNHLERPERGTETTSGDNRPTRNSCRLSQTSWKKLLRARLSIDMDNGASQGLVGGGCISSRSKKVATAPQGYRPMNASDEVMKQLRAIEDGVHNGEYSHVFGGLSAISNWENTQRPSDAAARLIRLLCDATSEGLPYLLKEKLIEKLPVLLYLVLEDPNPITLTEKTRNEMIEKISSLIVNKEVVGGPEIEYYRDLCQKMIKKFPSPTDWASLFNTIGDVTSIAKAFFDPFSAELSAIKSLYSLGERVYELFQRQRENVLLSEYVTIQYLKLGVVNNVEESLEKLAETAKAENSNLFVRKTCLLVVKQLMMSTEDGNLREKLENLLLEMVENQEIQNMAIRVCLEAGSCGYSNALNWIQERKKSLPRTSDVLKYRLLNDSEKIIEEFKQFNINWNALKGISPENYKNAVRAFKNECKEVEMVYVDIDVSESDKPDAKTFQALSKVAEFLDNSNLKVLVLLGNPGSGKSLFCQWLGKYLLESYNSYFPLYGYLPAIENIKNDFAKYCLEKRNLYPATAEFVNRKILFLLDAYDEINRKVNLIDSNDFFNQFPQCKVLITCRTHEVNSLDNFVRSAAGVSKISERKILYIRPFSTEMMREYIEKIYHSSNQSSRKEEKENKERDNPEETMNKIESIPGLKNMLDTPFMLRICLYDPNLLHTIDEQNLTRFGIYAQFMQSYHRNNIKKLRKKDIDTEPEEYTQACIDYAFETFKSGKIEWTRRRAQSQINIRAGCPLKGISFGKEEGEATELTFIHPSVYEYFIALQFKHILESHYSRQPEEFTDQNLAEMNTTFICDKVNILNFIADYLTKEHEEVLLSIVRIRKSEFKIASANSITILNHSGYCFIGKDLRGIQIEGAVLSGANLAKSDLSGSSMKNVNLEKSCLDFTNICDCDLRGAFFRERAPLIGHKGEVRSVSFSPDGKYLASASGDCTLRVWDLETSTDKPKYTLKGYSSKVNSVSFSPDGKYLASASGDYDDNDCTVRVWDLETSIDEPKHILEGHSSEVNSVSFSPDGKYLASASYDCTVRVWDLQTSTDEPKHTLQSHFRQVNSVSFSPDGKYLVSASGDIHGNDCRVRVWNLEMSIDQPKYTLEGYSSRVNSVSFSPDGKYLASASGDYDGNDCTVRVWDLETSTDQPKHILQGHSSRVNSVSFSPDGKYLTSASEDCIIRVWDLEISTDEPKHTLQGHNATVYSVSFSPDGKHLASASGDYTLRVWDLETYSDQPKRTLEGHSFPVNSISFSPNGKYLASASGDYDCNDCTVRVWDLETSTDKPKHTLQGHDEQVNSVCFSPDGKYLASASGSFRSKDCTVRVWDLETSTDQPKYSLQGHFRQVNSVSFSPDGKYLASASGDGYGRDCTVRVWDLEISTDEPKHTLEGHSSRINSVSFSPNGKCLASASGGYRGNDCTVRVWDLETSTDQPKYILQCDPQNVYSVSFSPDGKYLISASSDILSGTVRVWDLETSINEPKHTLHGHSSRVNSVSFSPDGKYLASASDDCTVRIWDLEISTDQPKYTIQSHSSKVNSVSFSPDGQFLASASDDTTVRIWDFLQNSRNQHFFGLNNRFAYSSDGDIIVEFNDNKILAARILSSGQQDLKYQKGADISNYPDLAIVEDPQIPLLPLHQEFSTRPRAYGVLFSGALISRRNLELLIYKRYRITNRNDKEEDEEFV